MVKLWHEVINKNAYSRTYIDYGIRKDNKKDSARECPFVHPC